MQVSCRMCGAHAKEVFTAQVLRKHNIRYYRCSSCGFLQTEEPYWLNEAYSRAINVSDTGMMARSLHLLRRVSGILLTFFDPHAYYVDYGGGYGVFTRLMRDIGFDFHWSDPYSENIFSIGFEHDGRRAEAVTTFETFEHFADPAKDIDSMLDISDTIIFTTELIPEETPPRDWWYYGLEHGQHISFYSERSLCQLAERKGLHFYTCRGVHILTSRKLNQFKLRMARKLPGSLVREWAGRELTSRSVSDMNYVIKQLQQGQLK